MEPALEVLMKGTDQTDSGGHFKNVYELLNLRAHKILMLY